MFAVSFFVTQQKNEKGASNPNISVKTLDLLLEAPYLC